MTLVLHDGLVALHELFAAPQPTLGLGLGRMVLGLVLAADGMQMLRDHDVWYADDALRPPGRSRLPIALDPFVWAERLGLSSRVVFHLMNASALAFAIGLFSAVSGALLLLTLLAIPARNLLVVYGGDAFARTLVLLLVLSPCGSSISVDRWLEDGSLGLGQQAPAWGGRLAQLEVVLLYLYNVLYKLPSTAWRRGTAMFDLLRNRNFARGDVPPWLGLRTVCVGLTWGALAAELTFGVGLLNPSTAGVCCVAAIAFHLMIARMIDVHRFSHVMIAGLLLYLPPSLVLAIVPADAQIATPPTSIGDDAVPLILALIYATYAVLGDAPGRRRATRRLVGAWLARLHWVRGWRLFTESCRHQLEVEFVVVTENEVIRWTWDRPEALRPGDERGLPNVPGHRFQRFKFSLLDRRDARQRLVARVRKALRKAGIQVRALSIDGLFFDVRDPLGPRGPVVHGVDLHTAVAAAPQGGLDHDAWTRLAQATRCPATRHKLVRSPGAPAPRSPSTEDRRDGVASPR